MNFAISPRQYTEISNDRTRNGLLKCARTRGMMICQKTSMFSLWIEGVHLRKVSDKEDYTALQLFNFQHMCTQEKHF